MHVSAILDEGTLLSNGALRSMAIERTPGYGKVVIANQRLGDAHLLIAGRPATLVSSTTRGGYHNQIQMLIFS